MAKFVVLLIGSLLFVIGWGSAKAETCFSAGERSAGMNKICYYDCLSGQASKTISSVELCPLSVDSGQTRGGAAMRQSPSRVSTTCFKRGEYTDGMNKVCRYDCLGSPAEMTISSVKLCPLTMKQ